MVGHHLTTMLPSGTTMRLMTAARVDPVGANPALGLRGPRAHAFRGASERPGAAAGPRRNPDGVVEAPHPDALLLFAASLPSTWLAIARRSCPSVLSWENQQSNGRLARGRPRPAQARTRRLSPPPPRPPVSSVIPASPVSGGAQIESRQEAGSSYRTLDAWAGGKSPPPRARTQAARLGRAIQDHSIAPRPPSVGTQHEQRRVAWRGRSAPGGSGRAGEPQRWLVVARGPAPSAPAVRPTN